jgi:hypothetical protein
MSDRPSLDQTSLDDIIIQSYAPLGEIATRFIRYATSVEAMQLPTNYLTGEDLPHILKFYKDAVQSWPFFIDADYFKAIEIPATQIPRLISKIPKLFFDNDPKAICDYFNLENELFINMLINHKWQGPAIIARGDFINTSDGLKCLEQNMGSNLGGWETEVICDDYLKTPAITPFLAANPVSYLPKNVLQAWFSYCIGLTLKHTKLVDNGQHNLLLNTPKDYIAGGMDTYFCSIYQAALAEHQLEGQLFIDLLSNLDIKPQGVFYQQQRIHCISNPISSELPPMLLRAYMGSKVYLADDPINTLLCDKRTLALLSTYGDSDEHFTAQEQQLIQRHIPWTREFSQSTVTYQENSCTLEALALSQQHEFVLKPANGKCGKDLYIGHKISAEQWREVIKNAVEEQAWVLQQYYPSLPYLGQMGEQGYGTFHAIWGTFCFGDTLGKVWMRLQPAENSSGIINSYQGAEETMVYIMDPAPKAD